MATIDLTRDRFAGNPYGMSVTAPSTPDARVAEYLAAGGADVDGRHLTRRHRGAQRATRNAFVQVVAALAWCAVTLINVTREYGLHAAGMVCLVVAGFEIDPALGWTAAGAAIMWTDHLRQE